VGKCLETDASTSSLLNSLVVILRQFLPVDVGAEAPSKQIAAVDVLEDVQCQQINEVEMEVHPALSMICRARDKFWKPYLQSHAHPIALFLGVVEPKVYVINDAYTRLGLPLMPKSKTLAALPVPARD
jgi:hypothetical protein